MRYITTPPILKDKSIVFPFLASFVLLIFSFSFVYVNLVDVSNLLIIHFDAYRGADFFGEKGDIFNILLLGLAVLVLNGLLAGELYFRERFLAYVLAFGSVLFSLLIFIGIVAIISVN